MKKIDNFQKKEKASLFKLGMWMVFVSLVILNACDPNTSSSSEIPNGESPLQNSLKGQLFEEKVISIKFDFSKVSQQLLFNKDKKLVSVSRISYEITTADSHLAVAKDSMYISGGTGIKMISLTPLAQIEEANKVLYEAIKTEGIVVKAEGFDFRKNLLSRARATWSFTTSSEGEKWWVLVEPDDDNILVAGVDGERLKFEEILNNGGIKSGDFTLQVEGVGNEYPNFIPLPAGTYKSVAHSGDLKFCGVDSNSFAPGKREFAVKESYSKKYEVKNVSGLTLSEGFRNIISNKQSTSSSTTNSFSLSLTLPKILGTSTSGSFKSSLSNREGQETGTSSLNEGESKKSYEKGYEVSKTVIETFNETATFFPFPNKGIRIMTERLIYNNVYFPIVSKFKITGVKTDGSDLTGEELVAIFKNIDSLFSGSSFTGSYSSVGDNNIIITVKGKVVVGKMIKVTLAIKKIPNACFGE